MRQLMACGLCVALGAVTLGAQEQMRRRQPRIPPLSETAQAAVASEALTRFGPEPTTFVLTLAQHPAALEGIGPLARYIRERSMVTAVDQALLAMRAAWLCGAAAIWAERAVEAKALGLTDADLRRIAEGPEAGWGAWDATVLRAADELYRDSFLSDETWSLLADRYDGQQLIDIIFTAAEYIMLSMMANSFGVQPDPHFPDRLPTDVPRHMAEARSTPVQLETPRLDPLPTDEWSDEVRVLLDPNGTGRPTINLYRTLARHPVFYRPRAVQSAYIRTGATLSERAREILILRIGWLCGAEYEWAQHVRAGRRAGLTDDEIRRIAVGAAAPGWDPFEANLLRATDELYRDDMVSDATWAALAERYTAQELIDLVITVGGYRMVSMALNSLGTQLESGREGFPSVRRE